MKTGKIIAKKCAKSNFASFMNFVYEQTEWRHASFIQTLRLIIQSTVQTSSFVSVDIAALQQHGGRGGDEAPGALPRLSGAQEAR